MKTDPEPRYLHFGGHLVPYADARLHVLSTTVKYGIGVFEGLRAYWNNTHGELYCFRLEEHLSRLRDSLHLMEIDPPKNIDGLAGDLIELIRANGFRENLHLRVQIFVAADDGTPASSGPSVVSMAAMPMNNYFGQPALEACVSSWARISDRAVPPRIKAMGNYQNSRLALLEARRNGYGGALLLTEDGRLSEGPGYNVFIVRNGVIATPRLVDAILQGVTRDSVIRLASEDLGLSVEERPIDRTELYLADEVFVCGSAAEVSAVTSIDRRPVGLGSAGKITAALQSAYSEVVRHERRLDLDWTRPVYGPEHGSM